LISLINNSDITLEQVVNGAVSEEDMLRIENIIQHKISKDQTRFSHLNKFTILAVKTLQREGFSYKFALEEEKGLNYMQS
jgi:hypothetical protein